MDIRCIRISPHFSMFLPDLRFSRTLRGLREVLVTRKARCSAMMRWTDQPMGACYAK